PSRTQHHGVVGQLRKARAPGERIGERGLAMAAQAAEDDGTVRVGRRTAVEGRQSLRLQDQRLDEPREGVSGPRAVDAGNRVKVDVSRVDGEPERAEAGPGDLSGVRTDSADGE